jgi:hypothetical protein
MITRSWQIWDIHFHPSELDAAYAKLATDDNRNESNYDTWVMCPINQAAYRTSWTQMVI